jgi:hypothetical protein
MTRRNNTLRVGDRVQVNKDLTRLPNPSTAEEKERFSLRKWDQMMTDSECSVKQVYPLTPESQYTLYAKKGETGTIVQNFGSEPKYFSVYLSVQMDDGSKKTFRSGSLTRI